MVVKPYDFIVKNGRELLQPAVKCRGREYLRIIYGPEYTMDENIERLRNRAVGKKRSLALREFSLGMEALERFVRNEPLYRVHECVFGVLALESEPGGSEDCSFERIRGKVKVWDKHTLEKEADKKNFKLKFYLLFYNL